MCDWKVDEKLMDDVVTHLESGEEEHAWNMLSSIATNQYTHPCCDDIDSVSTIEGHGFKAEAITKNGLVADEELEAGPTTYRFRIQGRGINDFI